MQVVMPNGTPESSLVSIRQIKKGETFRFPHQDTVYMVTANNSRDCHRSQQIRTVSMIAGSVTYKDPDSMVIRVHGYFQVTDWGENP